MNSNQVGSALGARCPLHPENQAVGACDHCGQFLCADCVAKRADQRIVCEECVLDWAPRDALHYVPVARLAVMSVLTVGLYPIAWHYQVWKSMSVRYHEPKSAFIRALFNQFTYPLMLQRLREDEPDAASLSYGLGLGYFVCQILATREGLWTLPIGASAFLFLVPVASMIAKTTPEAIKRERDQVGVRHLVAGVLGIMLWGLIVLGELAPYLEG